jgi:glycosyltransferase involved in cell wall biosynthesis
MKTINVTLDYASVTGGSAESVRQFERALGSATISFTSHQLFPQAVRSPNVLHVLYQGSGFAKGYSRPSATELHGAEDVLRGADLIFCHKLFRFHNDWVYRTARRLRIPYCIIPHGSLDPYVFTYRRFRKRLWMASLGKRFFEGAAGLIFATQREKEKALCRIRAGRTWVINWPLPDWVPPDACPSREATRKQFGVAPGERVLLFLGRLHPMKRPLETIGAFGRARVTGVHLVIVGPEDAYSKADLLDFAQQRGIANVHVVGAAYGKEKWGLYHSSDAFISLSARENFGFTVAEALAANLPVLLSSGNDLVDDIRHTDCGWFLENDSEQVVAESIRDFATASPETLTEMGARGNAWALANTGAERFRSNLLSVCREVVGHD